MYQVLFPFIPYLKETSDYRTPLQARSHAQTHGAASPEPAYNHVHLSFRLPFFRSISCTSYQRFSLDFSGCDLAIQRMRERGRVAVNKGMRNRSSAASRGDQQVLAAEGCSYAAAFKLAKRHDKHLLYCNNYYSMLCMTGATPPPARNRLLAALLYSGRPASIRSGTQYWGGNGRPGRPYGYGPALNSE